MPRYTAARLFAALLLALPLLAACSSNDDGGGGDVEPEEWAAEVCDGVVEVGEANEESSEQISEAFDEGPEAYHEALVNYLDEGIERTQGLRDDVEELGAPDLEVGTEVFEAMLLRLDENEDRLRDINNAVEDLDPGDDDYFGQVQDIADAPRSDFLLTLERIGGDVDILLDAIEDDDECAEILFAEPENVGDADPTPDNGSGGEGLTSVEWAAEVCPVFSDIEAAIQDGTNRTVRATTYPELHGFLVDQFTAERELYVELGETLEEVGPPDIEGGEEIYTLFVERQESALATADDVLAQLEPLNPRMDEYEGQLSAVFASIPDSTPLRVRLEELAGEEPAVDEFLDALRDEPGCGNLVQPDDQVMEAPQDPVPPSGNALVSGEEWVEGVCTSVVLWVERVETLVEDLQGNTDPDDLVEIKEFTYEFFDDTVFETDQLILDLRALGIPDVENGEEIADAMQQGFSDLGDALAEVRDGVAELPEDDPAAFEEGLNDLLIDFDEAVAAADDFFTTLEDDIDTTEIDAIFDQEPACQEL